MRHDGRSPFDLRPLQIQRPFLDNAAPGSILIKSGRTTVLCTASIDQSLPPWKAANPAAAATGWLTAEYSMLPGSTVPRKRRDRDKLDGRTTEIQRLIGRSLRAVIDFEALGPRSITVDCDVLEADGGTRTLSITGGFLAICDAVKSIRDQLPSDRPVIKDTVAAISVGIVNGEPVVDLDYVEDSTAEVDMNVVMTGSGHFIEVQGTAEGQPYSRERLNQQLDLAVQAINRLTALQRQILVDDWTFPEPPPA